MSVESPRPLLEGQWKTAAPPPPWQPQERVRLRRCCRFPHLQLVGEWEVPPSLVQPQPLGVAPGVCLPPGNSGHPLTFSLLVHVATAAPPCFPDHGGGGSCDACRDRYLWTLVPCRVLLKSLGFPARVDPSVSSLLSFPISCCGGVVWFRSGDYSLPDSFRNPMDLLGLLPFKFEAEDVEMRSISDPTAEDCPSFFLFTRE